MVDVEAPASAAAAAAGPAAVAVALPSCDALRPGLAQGLVEAGDESMAWLPARGAPGGLHLSIAGRIDVEGAFGCLGNGAEDAERAAWPPARWSKLGSHSMHPERGKHPSIGILDLAEEAGLELPHFYRVGSCASSADPFLEGSSFQSDRAYRIFIDSSRGSRGSSGGGGDSDGCSPCDSVGGGGSGSGSVRPSALRCSDSDPPAIGQALPGGSGGGGGGDGCSPSDGVGGGGCGADSGSTT